MSWSAQVVHILRKDLLESKWMIGAYAAIVVLVTTRAAGWLPVPGVAGLLGVVLVTALGVFIMAAVVQNDSPVQPTAYWTSHPISPAAMLGAKMTMGLLLVLVGTVGQGIALVALDAGAAESAPMALRSGGLFMSVLLLAMVLGAITRDLKAFALLLLAYPVLAIGRTLVTEQLPREVGPNASFVLAVLSVGAAIGFLAWMYRRRDTRRAIRIGGAAVVTLLAFGPDGDALAAGNAPELGSDGPRAGFRALPPARDDLLAPRHVGIEVEVLGYPEGYVFELRRPIVTVMLRDGERVRLRSSSSSHIGHDALPKLAGIRWLDPAVRPEQRQISLTVEPSPDQRRRFAKGIERIIIEGRVTVSQPRARDTVPLRHDPNISVRGGRLAISEIEHSGGYIAFALSSMLLDDAGAASGINPFSSSHVLINRRRGQGVRLDHLDRSGGSSIALVLPGVRSRSEETRLGTNDRFGHQKRPALPPEWLPAAELVTINWRSMGSYAVRLETTVK